MSNSTRQVIHSFLKKQDEEIQLALKKYNGQFYIDFRIWFKSPEFKDLRPTQKGVYFSIESIGEFRKGIEKLWAAADRLTESGGSDKPLRVSKPNAPASKMPDAFEEV